jgi:hypothetical protein
MKHVLLKNPRLQGWEYGMLRALEAAIVADIGAEIIEVPDYGLQPLLKRAGHGMRLHFFRDILPKKKIKVNADVLWYILMGPEDMELDLFEGWEHVQYRIVYLFDTLPQQVPILKKAFSGKGFTHMVTSFNDAVPMLESVTGNKWHVVEQAVPKEFFTHPPLEERVIHFSSYGRRLPGFHNLLLDFCKANGLYYDYTTHDGKHPTAEPEALYKQYAWHLSHSLFTISWPVEMTNPTRAGNLHPITCRWFEAVAVGTIVAGRAPANPAFSKCLSPNLVADLDPHADKNTTYKQLDQLWNRREALFMNAQLNQQEKAGLITWNNRIKTIVDLTLNSKHQD